MAYKLKRAEDGGVDHDQTIGSILERWLTTPCKGKCRFCRQPLEDLDVEPNEQFCSLNCKNDWHKVMRARIAIGQRDLRQRGHD